jgi:hypothetical protein
MVQALGCKKSEIGFTMHLGWQFFMLQRSWIWQQKKNAMKTNEKARKIKPLLEKCNKGKIWALHRLVPHK